MCEPTRKQTLGVGNATSAKCILQLTNLINLAAPAPGPTFECGSDKK